MKKNRRARRAGLFLSIAASFAIAGSSSARADDAQPLPEPSEQYATEQVGPVTWVYPEDERNRVVPLFGNLPERWSEIVLDLGVAVDDTLIVRVAKNPEEMRALAPVGAPPPDYATGVAYPNMGLILLTMSAPTTWEPPELEVVLTHELSHIALARAVAGNRVPRWFNEGLAIQQSEVRLLPRMQSLLRAAATRSMLRLSELSDRFPRRAHDVNVAYAQSADIVGFMRDSSSDQRRFHRLIREIRGGVTFDTALAESYGWTSVGLEREWRESLRTRYRITPALLGGTTIWVLAAILVVVAYRRRRRYHHAKLQEMGYREELEQVSSVPPPPPPEALAVADAGVPRVEHDGESHTLH